MLTFSAIARYIFMELDCDVGKPKALVSLDIHNPAHHIVSQWHRQDL
jgi:hypothetical protein